MDSKRILIFKSKLNDLSKPRKAKDIFQWDLPRLKKMQDEIISSL
jgi:hypothetical protein